MPKIQIKRGTPTTEPTLDDGELYLATGGDDKGRLYAGGTGESASDTDNVRVKYSDNADNAGDSIYATKIGSGSSHPKIGGDTDEDGQGTGLHDGLKPVFVNSSGEVTAASLNHGSPTNPVYVKNGGIRRCTGSVGGATFPVYMSDGSFYETSEYAGGTKVTLNGSDKGHDTATIYAPETLPSGATWTGARIPLYRNGQKPILSTGAFGSERKPLYLDSDGNLTAGKEYHAPTTYGTKYQIAMSDGSGNDTVWRDCLNVPFVESPAAINDNGLYVAVIRVTLPSVTTDCTVTMAVSDKNKVNISSASTAYADITDPHGGDYATVQMRRGTDGSLGAYITDSYVFVGSASCQLLGVYKLADTH